MESITPSMGSMKGRSTYRPSPYSVTLSLLEREVEFRIWTDALHNGCIERLRLLFENVAVRIDILLFRLVGKDVVHHVEGINLLRTETQHTILLDDHPVFRVVITDEFEFRNRDVEGIGCVSNVGVWLRV